MTSETFMEMIQMLNDGRIKMPDKTELYKYRKHSQWEYDRNREENKNNKSNIVTLNQQVA